LDLYTDCYFHLYNRSINRGKLFQEKENYEYFLNGYRKRFLYLFDTLGYCLMPTHFHFLIHVKTEEINIVKRKIGDWLSSYSKAFNNRFRRRGSLFQQHTKAVPIIDDRQLLTVLTYIHQNPVRAGLVQRCEDWLFSSYLDLCGLRNGMLVNNERLTDWFHSTEDFREFSEIMLDRIDSKVWI
jgi:putative transposase